MSHPVPPQPSHADAARSDSPSTPPGDRPLTEFQLHGPHSPIEREIERSERASAALAATRVLARASSFTDSQLAAEEAAGHHEFHSSDWARTEYAALDHPIRDPQDDAAREATSRNLLGGTFNPGIASQHGRAFPGISANTPIRTRNGAQARFMQESRLKPRGESMSGARARSDPAASAAPHYDKPAVIPMLAPAMAPVAARSSAPKRSRTSAGGPSRFLLAAGLGAVVVLLGSGVAWKAGWLSHDNDRTAAATVAAPIAPKAEAARVLAPAQAEIPIVPTAGVPAPRSDEATNAALAAAARAAAVPTASVRAAGPTRVARPLPQAATAAIAAPIKPSPAKPAPASGKDSVAEAIANAQARADRFLSSDNAGSPAAAATTEPKQAQ